MKKIIILFSILAFISCKKENAETLSSSEIIAIDTISKIVEPIVPPVKKELTPQEKYLSDNGFKIDAGFTDSQFKEFKSAIKTGLFKKESFCDVYKKALNLQDDVLKQYLRKYKKIPYFETILFMYGPKVCDMSSPKHQTTSSASYTNTDESANPCIISKDFIKQDLRNPSSADFSIFDCSTDKNSDGTYTILRKVAAKNSLGVESTYIYKLTLGFKGGNWVDMSNWTLIKMQSEEYK
jgi:hypothetical protein